MSLRKTDEIIVSPEAIAYIEAVERQENSPLAKFEVIEHFFDWFSLQPREFQRDFLKQALGD